MTARGRFLTCLTMMTWLLAASLPAQAYSTPGQLAPLSGPEKWVLEKITRGEEAKFASRAPRTLRVKFIVALLTGGFPGLAIPYQGLRITNAVIGEEQKQEELNLENAVVAPAVTLHYCTFNGLVNFGYARFQQNLDLYGSTFKKGLDARHMRADQDVLLGRAHFQGPTIFRWARVKGNLLVNAAEFHNATIFDGNSLQVEGSFFIRKALFQVPVDLVGATIGLNLEGDGVRFLASKGEVNCNGLKAGKNIFLRRAEFRGPVDCGAVRVGENLELKEARFANYPVNFNGVKIQNSLKLNSADFLGPVNFSAAQIGYNFEAKSVRFGSRKKSFFNSLQVGRSLFLDLSGPGKRPTSFAGPAVFQFISVGVNLYLDDAEFQDRADFFRAAIANELRVTGTKFKAAKPVIFEGMQAGYAYFRDNSFQTDVDLANGVFTDLSIAGAPAKGASQSDPAGQRSIDRLMLNNTSVKRNLTLSQLTMQSLQADFLEVKGAATFKNVRFLGQVNLTSAGFQTLRLINPQWPHRRDQVSNVWLDRVTYATITSTDELLKKQEIIDEDHQQLLQWFETFRFNIENYVQLENYARHAGYSDWADEVYIAGKRREWRQESFSLSKIVTWLFWDKMAGFGRKPFWVLGWAVFFVFLGAIIFDPSYVEEPNALEKWDWAREILEISPMEAIKSFLRCIFIKPDHRKFYMFLRYFFGLKLGLSLDIFIPTENPVLVHRWDRYAIPNWMRVYYYIHRALGMALVPIAAAAFFIHFHISTS